MYINKSTMEEGQRQQKRVSRKGDERIPCWRILLLSLLK